VIFASEMKDCRRDCTMEGDSDSSAMSEESFRNASKLDRYIDVDTIKDPWQPKPLRPCQCRKESASCHYSPKVELAGETMRFGSDAIDSPVVMTMGFHPPTYFCIRASAKAMQVAIEHPYILSIMALSAARIVEEEGRRTTTKRGLSCLDWPWIKMPIKDSWPRDFLDSVRVNGVREEAYEGCFVTSPNGRKS